MTDNPCNCSTCTTHDFPENGCELKHCHLSDDEKELIRLVGCLSHPQSREYLMKPVIEELDQLLTMNVLEYQTNPDSHQKERSGAYSKAFNRAISLIKNGVDK